MSFVPDYESRVEVMRTAGIDRGVFLSEVWGPVFKRLKITRQRSASPQARAPRPDASQEQRGPSNGNGQGGAGGHRALLIRSGPSPRRERSAGDIAVVRIGLPLPACAAT